MGLERVAAVLQGVHSNYEIDLFQDLIRAAARETGQKKLNDPSLNVIADHIRACSFLIVDGVIPGNEGRGYVLRRILRRAARHARQLGFAAPILCRVTQAVVDTMGAAYPEIVERQGHIEQVLRAEEERFGETLDKGLTLLDHERAALRRGGAGVLPGAVAFKLYDTFGFPLDMTQDILRSDGIGVDVAGFEACMAEQRQRGREARRAGLETMSAHGTHVSRFVGDRVDVWESQVEAILVDGGAYAGLG